MLRPRALTSRKLGSVSADAEALYYRLMVVADDFGRFHGDPILVESACYPRRERQIGTAFQELAEVGLIHLYEAAGEQYLTFALWDQTIRAKESKFPDPPADVSTRAQMRADVPVVVDVDGDGDEEQSIARVELEPDAFEEFWAVYPRKVGKRKALGAWRAALRRTESENVIDGARHYRDDPNRQDEFTAHPTTWLNRDGWNDAPLPERRGAEPFQTEATRLLIKAAKGGEDANSGHARGAPRAGLPGSSD